MSLGTVYAQKYEIAPLVGGMAGGTLKLEQEGLPNVDAHSEDSFSFGIAGGFRFDADDIGGDVCEACNLIEFRWLRQNTHLRLDDENVLVPAPHSAPAFYPRVTLDNFLVDFTREWPLNEGRRIRPFLTASLGAALMSTPESSATRFVFGIGTGVKIFPKRRWGILFQAEYLPVVMHVDVQRVICGAGCIVALGGGVMNRFEFSLGPIFRF